MSNRFELFIYTDNAAFEPDARAEVARLLRHVAAKIEDGATDAPILDINGNLVGKFNLEA